MHLILVKLSHVNDIKKIQSWYKYMFRISCVHLLRDVFHVGLIHVKCFMIDIVIPILISVYSERNFQSLFCFCLKKKY